MWDSRKCHTEETTGGSRGPGKWSLWSAFTPVTYEASEAQNPLTTERQQLGPPEKEEREDTGHRIKVGLRHGTVRVCWRERRALGRAALIGDTKEKLYNHDYIADS